MIDLSKTIDLSVNPPDIAQMPAPRPWCCSPCSKNRSISRATSWTAFSPKAPTSRPNPTTSFPRIRWWLRPRRCARTLELTHHVMAPEHYLKHIARCKQAVQIPIVASLNGTTTGGWLKYAKQMQEAGADALELNIYYIPVDPDVTADQVEQRYIDMVRAVKSEVHIPVAVK